jgi:hypothetical protein
MQNLKSCVPTIMMGCLFLAVSFTFAAENGKAERSISEPAPIQDVRVVQPRPLPITGNVRVENFPTFPESFRIRRQKWEYRLISTSMSGDTPSLPPTLQALGGDGWEAVNISPGSGVYWILLKRPINPN